MIRFLIVCVASFLLGTGAIYLVALEREDHFDYLESVRCEKSGSIPIFTRRGQYLLCLSTGQASALGIKQ